MEEITFDKLLELDINGKLSNYVFDLDDKRGSIKIYQGDGFIITDSHFITEHDTSSWQHFNDGDFIEFNFIVKGSLYQTQEGLFEQKLYTEGYHNWLSNPNGIEENCFVGQGEYQIICIYFHTDTILSLLKKYTPDLKIIINQIIKKKSWVKSPEIVGFSKRLLYLLKNIWIYPPQKKMQSLYFETIVHQIFCEQYQLLFHAQNAVDEYLLKKDDIIKLNQAVNILKERYNDPPLLKELAQECGLNEYKLKKGFKQLYGMTVTNYVQNIRMSMAKELIIHTDKTISEIAFELGYSHSQHFHRVFKKQFGVVPMVLKK